MILLVLIRKKPQLTLEQLGVRAPTLCSIASPPYTRSLRVRDSSVSMVPHPWIQPIAEHVVLKYIFIEKNPRISGPVQFKPMLFKEQLYFRLMS